MTKLPASYKFPILMALTFIIGVVTAILGFTFRKTPILYILFLMVTITPYTVFVEPRIFKSK